MTRARHTTNFRIGKQDAEALAEELEARAVDVGPKTTVGRGINQVAQELRKRLAAGWRTPEGFPMTYFSVDASVRLANGKRVVDVSCG